MKRLESESFEDYKFRMKELTKQERKYLKGQFIFKSVWLEKDEDGNVMKHTQVAKRIKKDA